MSESEQPRPWDSPYPHKSAAYQEIYDRNAPSGYRDGWQAEAEYAPTASGATPTSSLIWGGFPTLIEKLRYRSLERKKLKAMTPQARADYKEWQKFQRKLGN